MAQKPLTNATRSASRRKGLFQGQSLTIFDSIPEIQALSKPADRVVGSCKQPSTGGSILSGGAIVHTDDSDHFADDPFAPTRMSFWDHIEELRRHLWRALIGFGVALVVGLGIGRSMEKVIAGPVEAALNRFYERRLNKVKADLQAGDQALKKANEPRPVRLTLGPDQLDKLAQALGTKRPEASSEIALDLDAGIEPVQVALALGAAERLVGRRPTLATMSATEGFFVYFKVSMYCGVVLASPWIFWQLWSFVATGLYPHEKRAVNRYLPISIGLFVAGVCLCQFLVIPAMLDYLLSFNEWMDLEPDLRLNEWLSFAIWVPLSFGVAFQLPLLMLFLYRIGVIRLEAYRSHRRLAYFLIACSYLIIGASPDALSMMMLTVPLWGLYELGILMCRWSAPPHDEDMEGLGGSPPAPQAV
jgi:sec-independent protein translocase protein TatC